MENARFNYIYAGALANIESPFTHTEVLCLTMVYHKFVLMNGPKAKYMSLGQVGTILMKMFLLSDIEINRRVVTFVSFNQECADPKFSPDRHCTLPSFVKLFHIYFSNDLEERMLFVFNVCITVVKFDKFFLSIYLLLPGIRWGPSGLLESRACDAFHRKVLRRGR